MKKKYLNTLVAIALLGALWGTITLWEKLKSRQAPKAESTPQEKILSLDSSHIQSLILKPRSGDPVICRREAGKWSIVEPRKLPADPSAVSSLLDTLTSATIDQVVEAQAKNPKDFGLEPPSETIDVSSDAKPQKFALLLGDDSPTGGGVYAQVVGTPRIVMLASYVKSSLGKTLFDLRDKRAVTLDTDHLQRIEVDSKGKRWTMVKNPEGVWDLVLPPPVRVDRSTVDGLVEKLRSATMQTVAAEEKKDSSKYGFGKPELRVQLSGSGASQSLVLGSKDKEGDRYFAMNSGVEPVFTLGSDFLTQFQKDPADLREKDLFSFSAYDSKHVEVDTPKGRRVFEKQKDKWKQTAPSAKDAASDKMDTLLSRLRDLRADSFPKGANLAAFGLTKPAYKFQVQFGDKNQTQTVDAAKVGDHIYARRSTDLLASELPKAALDDIEKALNEF